MHELRILFTEKKGKLTFYIASPLFFYRIVSFNQIPGNQENICLRFHSGATSIQTEIGQNVYSYFLRISTFKS